MVSETAGLSSTPPLFAMQGKKENTLRIIDATNNQLPAGSGKSVLDEREGDPFDG
ncbi:periplasmic chaperone [Klebsiella pneumoniae]|uniref:Periplasmic chaperone n=1 Tax=Klebsiella pneumoniae TaxID=573 RepID=A0A2X3F6M5_KLEPN|nr:periplasmic chaperone [Klebsiella pneumoniae]